MHVRPHNPKVDLAVSKTRRRSRSGASFRIGWQSGLLAVLGVFLFLFTISYVPSGQARIFGRLAGLAIVGILVFGRFRNNREFGWARRKRTLSAERERRGRNRVDENRVPRTLTEKARGKVQVRRKLVTGDVRSWKRERTPWVRIAALLVLLGAWAYVVGSWLSEITRSMGARGIHVPLIMATFLIAMAIGFKAVSLVLFPTRSRRSRTIELGDSGGES
tara:strand:- start:3050 stop:3706 length:657 start_codon:yes stop_codon:yes gene_type:complete